MSVAPARKRSAVRERTSWSSIAFIVESMLLLVFLVASLAVLTQLFISSLNRSVESRTLDASTIAATSIAEHFSADPTGVQERTQLGDLFVLCDVTAQPRSGGTMYKAHISVYDVSTGSLAYEMDTSRYESGVA